MGGLAGGMTRAAHIMMVLLVLIQSKREAWHLLAGHRQSLEEASHSEALYLPYEFRDMRF
jgi:hypothetical protein